MSCAGGGMVKISSAAHAGIVSPMPSRVWQYKWKSWSTQMEIE